MTLGSGVRLTDSATLAAGVNPTGTVTFYLFAPGMTPQSDYSNSVYTDVVTIGTDSGNITGNATYTTSMGNHPGGYLPTASGTYQWIVVYSGDTNNNPVAGSFGDEPEVAAQGGSISGIKTLDLTGNGFSSDDTPLSGVTINLLNTSGKVIETTTTGSDGTYSFDNLAPGTYSVSESVPNGFVQTGPTGGTNVSICGGNAVYTVSLGSQPISGLNFDDFQTDTCVATNISYEINGCNTVTNLRGHTHQGDTVTVTFTIPAGKTDQVSLVSYTAPGSSFDASTASLQQIFQDATGTFSGGSSGTTYTLTVTIPNCDYQIDFVCGQAIDRFGPAGSNIFYSAQSRLLSADNGGTQVCGTDCVSGTVFNDNNGDGKQQSGECGIDGVTITLTGKDCKGNAVYLCTTTDANGNYCFTGLQASDSRGYTITEAKPSGYTHKGQTAGCTGGTTDDCTITTFVNTNTCSSGNNFCETKSISGSNLTCGDTGIVDFWNGRDGQNLIKSLNGGSRSKNLANWLACTFPDLYGRNPVQPGRPYQP